jgi:cytochrome P450
MTDTAREPVPYERYPSLELNECPYPFFERALEQAPVYQDRESGVFLVFRHADIQFVLRRSDLFAGVNGSVSYSGCPMISATEPPDHKPLRDLAYRPFTPKRLREYTPMVLRHTTALIDRFVDHGEVELVDQFAVPLPGLVICELMGLPTEGDEFESILDRMSLRAPDHSRGKLAIGTTTLEPLARTHEQLKQVILERHEQPGDDILSEIVAAHVAKDGELNLELMVTVATELLAGGILTTAQMIANGTMLLLQHPDQLEKVRSDSSRIPRLLEETLRFESPVQSRSRQALVDVEVGGVQIPAGSEVLVVNAAGSRDPRRFPDADRFDVDRPRDQLKDHFGFGYGIHFCLGAPLARLEGGIAFEHLLTRLPNLRFAPGKNDFRHIERTHFRAVRRLHLEFDAA